MSFAEKLQQFDDLGHYPEVADVAILVPGLLELHEELSQLLQILDLDLLAILRVIRQSPQIIQLPLHDPMELVEDQLRLRIVYKVAVNGLLDIPVPAL